LSFSKCIHINGTERTTKKRQPKRDSWFCRTLLRHGDHNTKRMNLRDSFQSSRQRTVRDLLCPEPLPRNSTFILAHFSVYNCHMETATDLLVDKDNYWIFSWFLFSCDNSKSMQTDATSTLLHRPRITSLMKVAN